MRGSQAAKYARWSAAAAGVVTLAVAGVYAYRAWRAAEARREAPPAVPPAVQQQAAEFSFSKLEGGRKLFTVRASRTTEFTGGNLNRLEDVRITVYGRRGDRFDKIHTRACDYNPNSGDITCGGTVEIALAAMRAEEPHIEDWSEIAPSPHAVYVQTSSIRFSSETGLVHTDQPVQFTFPGGSGRGRGISYDTREGIARLHDGVELAVEASDVAGGEPTELSGTGLEFIRAAETLRLYGPVRARQGNRVLTAGALEFELDAQFRVHRAAAHGVPQLAIREHGRTRLLRAAEFWAQLLPGGGIGHLDAVGSVAASVRSDAVELQFTADRLAIAFDAAGKLPERVTLAGNVRGMVNRSGQTQRLQTDELQLILGSAAGGGRRVTHAESSTSTRIEWQTSQENLQLAGDRLRATFDPAGYLQQLAGGDGVEIRRRSQTGTTGTAELISRSREFVLYFVPDGGWNELEQAGDVRLREGTLAAQAASARITQADGGVVLRGSVVVTDGNARLMADRFTYVQRTGEIRAEGNVRTSYVFSGTNAATNFAAEPAMIAATSLQASREAHRAVYSGGVRLWQGPAVIESERMEIDQAAQQLVAEEKVLAVLPEPAAPDLGSQPRLWRISAGRLVYRRAEGRVHFEDTVRADSADSRIHAAWLELHLSEAGGKREIQRAVAGGGVTVRQGSRWATAERANYFAAEQKFVLSGGTATMHDALGNTVSGAELTFFLASDTIFVKSEEGSRTLTRYRVER